MLPFLAGMFGQGGGTSAPQGGDSVTLDTDQTVGGGSMSLGGNDFTPIMFGLVVVAALFLLVRRSR